jgi:hypothetical protein
VKNAFANRVKITSVMAVVGVTSFVAVPHRASAVQRWEVFCNVDTGAYSDAKCMTQTSDGGYVLAGHAAIPSEGWGGAIAIKRILVEEAEPAGSLHEGSSWSDLNCRWLLRVGGAHGCAH